MRNWLFIFLLSLTLFSQGQENYDPFKTTEPEKLLSDLDYLYKSLSTGHPGFTRYHSGEEMRNSFDSIKGLITKPMTELQFHKIVSPWIAKIGCGHTGFYMTREYRKNYALIKAKYFPFGVKIIPPHVYIIDNFSTDSSVARGSRILSINNRNPIEIVKEIIPYIASDGFNETYKYRDLEEDFMTYYSLFIGQPDLFFLKLTDEENNLKTTVVPALKYEDIRKISEKRYGHLNFDYRPLRFNIDSQKIATLVIRSFDAGDLRHNKQFFKRFIRRSFRKIKKENINNLVIDLRFNSGGNDSYGRYLYAMISKEPFRYYNEIRTASGSKPEFIRNTNRGSLFSTIFWLSKKRGDHFLWRPEHCCKLKKTHRLAFDGKIAVLINGESFSATTEFASVVHYNKRAIFIGEETGGAYEGNNSGVDMILTLPETRLRVSIPVLSYYSAVDPPVKGRGIFPHYEKHKTISDILNHEDPEMKLAKELLIQAGCEGCGR